MPDVSTLRETLDRLEALAKAASKVLHTPGNDWRPGEAEVTADWLRAVGPDKHLSLIAAVRTLLADAGELRDKLYFRRVVEMDGGYCCLECRSTWTPPTSRERHGPACLLDRTNYLALRPEMVQP